MAFTVLFSNRAIKDIQLLKQAKLASKAQSLCRILEDNPFQTPPPYEKLVGDLKGSYSRRINIQHRLVYEVREKENLIVILRMWSHYEWWKGAAIAFFFL